MLGGYWLFITVFLFVAALALRQVPLLLLSLLLFLAAGVAWLWGRYCLDRVEYGRKLSARRVFFGEEVQLEVQVTNRKLLPLPWVLMEDELPQGVTLLKGETSPSHKVSRVLLSHLFSLGWYHRVRRRYPMRCGQRGYFAFGPARLHSGDLFGFFNREVEAPQVDHLVVYPKIVPLSRLGLPSKQPFGDIRIQKQVFQDPVLTQGVRDYHFGDSLRRIHWKTSARLGRLQTRVYESTTTVDMGLFLDVRTIEPPLWGLVPHLLELGVVAAASLSSHALAEGYQVGLYVNQTGLPTGGPLTIPPSQHPDQLLRILDALARVQPMETMTIATLVQRESQSLPWGSTLVVITAVPTPALLGSLIKMDRAGRRVGLILVGGRQPSTKKDRFPVYHIPDEVMWHDLEELPLGR
ncbi:MAG: DUF58 domain-containing protein [Chloroflexota bacterium]|nr:DUF58 domain-containing protein [Chloroflexota bacterium]